MLFFARSVRTIFTNKFLSKSSSKQLGERMFGVCAFYACFYLINVEIEELIYISLFIYWHYLPIFFYGLEEIKWIIHIFLLDHKVWEKNFRLIQNIIFIFNLTKERIFWG